MRESYRALPSGGLCGLWVILYGSFDRRAAWNDIRLCDQSHARRFDAISQTRRMQRPEAGATIRLLHCCFIGARVLRLVRLPLRKMDEGRSEKKRGWKKG